MRLHKNLRYHEDTTPKHPLTEQRIQFLSELQKEMNTQDTVGQRNPRFWVIKGTETVYGSVNGEQRIFLNGTEYSTMCDPDLANMILEIAREHYGTQYKDYRIKTDSSIIDSVGSMALLGKADDNLEKDIESWYDFEELAEWIRSHTREDAEVRHCEEVSRNYPNTFFMTQKAAEEHLQANHYHYSADAHTYAMTAWRNPEADALWAFLQETDFEDLQKKMRCAELFSRLVKQAEEKGYTEKLREMLAAAGATDAELAKIL